MPDERFGEAITARRRARAPATTIDEAELIAHVKSKLAAYKAPQRVVVVDTIGRAANGKVDYKRLKGFATDELATRLTSAFPTVDGNDHGVVVSVNSSGRRP